MRRLKPVVVVMFFVMLLQTVTGCSLKSKSSKIVSEDDPWYETTKFKLDNDIKKNEEYDLGICTCDEYIFSLYCVSKTTWVSSRTVLDTYDLEGNLLSRQNVYLPDDLYVQRVYTVSVDPEGKTITALFQLNSPSERGAAFVKLDTATATLAEKKYVKSTTNGNVKGYYDNVPMFDSSIWFATSIGDYEAVITIDDYFGGPLKYDQLILFKDTELVCYMELEELNLRDILFSISIDESKNSLYLAGYEEADIVNCELNITTGELKNKKSFYDFDNESVNISEYTTTDNGELCKIDSLGNITRVDISDMTTATVIDTNWYNPVLYSHGADDDSAESKVLSYSTDRTILLDSEYKMYGMSGVFNAKYIRVLTKMDKNPHAGKEIIELAFPSKAEASAYLAGSIYEFNNTDDKYIIRIWDKQKVGFTLGIVESMGGDEQELYKFIQELRSDEAPDLIIGLQNSYALNDEILMDISNFLAPEVLDKQFGNILDAGTIGGKQYFLPVTLEIDGLIIDSDLIEDGAAGLTFDEYDKMVEEELKGYSPYDYPFSIYYNKNDFILSCIDIKSAIESGKVEFGTDQFYSAVEYASENFPYDDILNTPVDYIYDWEKRIRTKCCYAQITDYLDFVHLCNDSKKQYVIIGTPSVGGSGPRFKALETISVSASTDVSDGCKKFINYLFAGTAFDSSECEFRCIVTNKDIMDKNIESISFHNNELYDDFMGSVENGVYKLAVGAMMAYGDKSATDSMHDCFINSMSSISTYYYEDEVILGFLKEELAPYYAGDRSLEDVVVMINDKVARYCSEM